MSSKPKPRKSKQSGKRAETEAKGKAKILKPSGPVPIAQVDPYNSGIVSRAGRGFSLQELKEGNMTPQVAKKLGLYVDKRRSTKKEENVSLLKSWLST